MQKKAKTAVDAMLTRSHEGRLVKDCTLSGRRKVGKKSRPILCNMGRHWGTRYLTVTVSVHFLSLNVQMRLYLEVPHSLKFAPVLICIIIFLAFRFNVISEDCMIAFICSSLILCSD